MRFLLYFCLLGMWNAAQAEEWPVMHGIPIEAGEAKELILSEVQVLRFSYHANKVADARDYLSNSTQLSLGEIINQSFDTTLLRDTTLVGAPTESHLKTSFVIDNDEQATKRFLSGFISTDLSGALPIGSLVRYVSEYITEPTYIHGFHIASKVAQTRSGDCTEYAVLTVSLARSLGLPARFATGIALIQEGSQSVQAFGHAWAEIWQGEAWVIADAALHDLNNNQVFYLPISELDNEGPGYSFSMLSAVGYFPQKISKLRGE